jgi:hypothetical protein
MSKQNRANKNSVKLKYEVLDLVKYNGLTINGNMKILLSMIQSYASSGSVYYESVGTIGKRCGCGEEAVRNFRNKMRDAGMIKFDERDGSSHKYYPLDLDESLMLFIDDDEESKRTKKQNQKQKPEGSKNNGKSESKEQQPDAVDSSALGNDEQHGLQLTADNRGDDVPPNDAVSEDEDPVFHVSKAEHPQEAPPREDIQVYKSWREKGPSDFGFMEYGDAHGETDVEKITALIDQHYFEAFSQIVIFDENGVVREEFINALSGDGAPNRNNDGTLQSFRYTYRLARAYQAHRDGKSDEEIQSSLDVWFNAAHSWHIPVHLLPPEAPLDNGEWVEEEDSIPY